jgi:predicted dehydrogenase
MSSFCSALIMALRILSPTMKKKTLRLLFAGYGHMGAYLARRLAGERWCEVAAVADPSAEARSTAARLHGVPVHVDIERALAAGGADIAVINTPSEQHYAQSAAALRAGLHVLVAKPITNSLAEARKLVALAAAKRRKLAVGQQIRFNRHYLSVARFIRSGRLGKVEMVHFLNSKPRHQALNLAKMGQPAFYEMACHHFDSLLALFPQAAPRSIVADAFRPSWSVYAGPCMVNALITLQGGVHVLYHGGFSSQADCYELRLEGTKGALRCRGIHMSVDPMSYEFAPRGGRFAPIDLDEGRPPVNPWDELIARWRAWLAGGAEPPFSGRNNLKVFALLAAGIDSARTGRAVALR